MLIGVEVGQFPVSEAPVVLDRAIAVDPVGERFEVGQFHVDGEPEESIACECQSEAL